MKFVAILLGLVLLPVSVSARTVVLMLFDGFAPVYMESFETPTFDRMRLEGAWSHRMEPAFPTISLINGVTISTGCWPKNHGIVSNVFEDPERGVYDHSGDTDWLLGCEHLHQAAERQGVRSATYGWYGRMSTKNGPQASVMPDEATFQDYPDDLGRAAQVVELLNGPAETRPGLILAYFRGPDGSGHFNGMEAPETKAAVETADAAVAKVLEAAAELDDVSVLVTTDHGMMPVTHIVNIERILRRHDIDAKSISSGTSSFLYFEDPADAPEAARKLASYEEFDVVARDAQPDGWHLGTHERVGELIVSAKPPYFIESIARFPWYLRFLGYVGPDFIDSSGSLKATHGYPAGTPGVEGIFYAWGSGVAKARQVESLRAIDIHPTVMHLLGKRPGEPVDGEIVRTLLRR